jgi:hypothetical protein
MRATVSDASGDLQSAAYEVSRNASKREQRIESGSFVKITTGCCFLGAWPRRSAGAAESPAALKERPLEERP